MLQKKELNKLKEKIAFEAYKRWNERADVRKDPRILKDRNPDEFRKEELRQENYFTREQIRRQVITETPTRIVIPERIIRVNDLKDFPPTEEAQKAGVPVARLQNIPAQGIVAEGFATGFLIAPDLLMTNFHVFPDKDSARQCAADFMYERTLSGVKEGFVFQVDPDKFYLSDETLDYAIVFVEGQSLTGSITLRNFNTVPLIGTKGKVIKGSQINIIQYPSGGYKKYAFEDNIVLDIIEDPGYIQYTTDTQPGSSGSPAFNKSYELAALHHSGVPFIVDGQIRTTNGRPWDPDTMSDDDIQWIANEGISISSIIAQLKIKKMGNAEQQSMLDALLASVNDPVTESTTPREDPQPVVISKNDSVNAPKKINTMANDSLTLNFYGTTNVYIGTPPALDGMAYSTRTSALQVNAGNGNISNGNGLLKEKKQSFDPDYSNRPGYDPAFLQGFNIALPTVIHNRELELFTDFNSNKPYILNYYNYSLVMNKKRRFLMWSASNTDYSPGVKSTKDRSTFGGEDWQPDPRIPLKFQVTDADFYAPATKIDRGHIVRRDDNCWGSSETRIAYANADSYHWTNCTPQHEQFNRDKFGMHGLWGRLENQIQQELKFVDNKAIHFAGPILDNDADPTKDYGTGPVQYPLRFWKILLVNDQDNGLSAYGFILDQSDVIEKFGLEVLLDFSSFKAQQTTIQRITLESGVIFDQAVYDADVFKNQADEVNEGLRPFKNESQIIINKQKATAVEHAY